MYRHLKLLFANWHTETDVAPRLTGIWTGCLPAGLALGMASPGPNLQTGPRAPPLWGFKVASTTGTLGAEVWRVLQARSTGGKGQRTTRRHYHRRVR